jgi:oxygen-independent coproporphyrinogen III oxidase
MAGIYIHIPFCKQACHYCAFHFSTNTKLKDQMILAMRKEIELSREFIQTDEIETIYFGGGTPSLLDSRDIYSLLEKINKEFFVSDAAEITLEANPEDMSYTKLDEWKQLGVNRLSVGIQSFADEDLLAMNRVHNGEQAEKAIDRAISRGFENLSVDLIYGLPTTSIEIWNQNLEKIKERNISHLSCYSLTIEEKTKLQKMVRNGTIKTIDEGVNIEQFNILQEFAKINGYEHYEISNFAKDKKYSKHNTGYWFGAPYLGLGPSAHSYKDGVRRYNVSNNLEYIKGVNSKGYYFEEELLTKANKINEHILTRLRTQWGISVDQIKKEFDRDITDKLTPYIDKGHIELNAHKHYVLTAEGKLWADDISMGLFE